MYEYPTESSASWASRFLAVEPVPRDAAEIRSYIVERLRLPINVPRPEGDWTLTEGVVGIWKSVVESLEVDGESWAIDPEAYASNGFISHFYFEEKDPSSTLYDKDGHEDEGAIALRIASWYDRACERLSEELRLVAVPVAGPDDYPKHYPDAGSKTLADLRKRSRSKIGGSPVSILRFGLDQTAITELVHYATAECLDDLRAARDKQVFRAYVDTMIDIGYTDGRATKFLCIEWSPKMVHVYPVSEVETAGSVLRLDSLQFYVLDTPA